MAIFHTVWRAPIAKVDPNYPGSRKLISLPGRWICFIDRPIVWTEEVQVPCRGLIEAETQPKALGAVLKAFGISASEIVCCRHSTPKDKEEFETLKRQPGALKFPAE